VPHGPPTVVTVKQTRFHQQKDFDPFYPMTGQISQSCLPGRDKTF